MKNIFIKYNPYQVTTEVTIDDKPIKKNSRLNVPGQRLQEWIDNLPDILFEECSTREFDLTFHGTDLDYEDLVSVSKEAEKKGIIIKLNHIKAKEVKDKEQAIEEIFNDIQNGPFEELKQPDVIRAFKMAKSSDFEVNVVATMSAGKSTLINALLGKKLMPAKQEACTAMITEIHDNDADIFTADAFDKEGKQLESQPELTYEIMDRLNSNQTVSKVIVNGNIPFVESSDVSLVLIDTPGPNNARDPQHRVTTYNMLSESSKTLVLYILNAQQLAVDDDDALLSNVAESMKVGGKQSRDRFIFVINKMDEYWKKEDSVESAIKKVKDYLADKGIENPNIYPASAMTALYIRSVLLDVEDMSSDDEGEEELEEAKKQVRRSVNIDKLHFETYAPLSLTTKGIIENRLSLAQKNGDKKEQALVHSGIVPIEEAIKMYVLKYAKTAKIKNIVDTFAKKLESQKTFEKAKADISKNENEKEKIVKRIESVETKLKSGEEAKKFKSVIDKINYDKEINTRATKIVQEAENKITNYLKDSTKKEMSRSEAEDVYHKLLDKANDVQAKMKSDLESMVNGTVVKNASELLEQYKAKLAELVSELGTTEEVPINPIKLMEGRLSNFENIEMIFDNATDVKQVYEVVGNHKEYKEIFGVRRWLNRTFGANFNVDYDLIDDYDWVEHDYIDGQKLSDQFIIPVQEQLYENKDIVVEYAKKQTREIKAVFSREFEELDEVLTEKLDELKACATDEKIAKMKLEESENRLEWLEDIQNRINMILEI